MLPCHATILHYTLHPIITITYAWAHVPTQKLRRGHFHKATAEEVTTILSEKAFFCIHFQTDGEFSLWLEKKIVLLFTQVFGTEEHHHHECVFKIILNSMMIMITRVFRLTITRKLDKPDWLVYIFFSFVLLFGEMYFYLFYFFLEQAGCGSHQKYVYAS